MRNARKTCLAPSPFWQCYTYRGGFWTTTIIKEYYFYTNLRKENFEIWVSTDMWQTDNFKLYYLSHLDQDVSFCDIWNCLSKGFTSLALLSKCIACEYGAFTHTSFQQHWSQFSVTGYFSVAPVSIFRNWTLFSSTGLNFQ